MQLASISARHMEIFAAMMTSNGMAEAAARLAISVAAVSKTIAAIEREAGIKLFTKVGGRLQPTAEAERVFPAIQRALNQLADARNELCRHSVQSPRRIVIAAGGAALTYLVPEALRRMLEEFPDTQAEVNSNRTATILSMVANHEIDVGVTTPPVRDIDARILQLCEARDISNVALVAVMHKDHELATRRLIRPADLEGVPVITLSAQSPTTQLVQATFHQAHVPMRIAVAAGNSLTACCLAERGLGVALINPETLSEQIFPLLRTVPFRPRIPLRTCVYLPKFQAESPLVARFVTHLLHVAARSK
ncbi:MAG: LysR family transcriptional regulator [Paraburkholderia sp.]|jgi:DNA-binding transcriptional LysR family regulator|nr:LysR family transcriptional regulator [Paraburkholderia sp.]